MAEHSFPECPNLCNILLINKNIIINGNIQSIDSHFCNIFPFSENNVITFLLLHGKIKILITMLFGIIKLKSVETKHTYQRISLQN